MLPYSGASQSHVTRSWLEVTPRGSPGRVRPAPAPSRAETPPAQSLRFPLSQHGPPRPQEGPGKPRAGPLRATHPPAPTAEFTKSQQRPVACGPRPPQGHRLAADQQLPSQDSPHAQRGREHALHWPQASLTPPGRGGCRWGVEGTPAAAPPCAQLRPLRRLRGRARLQAPLLPPSPRPPRCDTQWQPFILSTGAWTPGRVAPVGMGNSARTDPEACAGDAQGRAGGRYQHGRPLLLLGSPYGSARVPLGWAGPQGWPQALVGGRCRRHGPSLPPCRAGLARLPGRARWRDPLRVRMRLNPG